MKWHDLFPELYHELILSRAMSQWDLFSWAYPVPKFRAKCPWCKPPRDPRWLWLRRKHEMHARSWGMHDRHPNMDRDIDRGRVRYRCDVNLKCAWCGGVKTWGVAVPDDWWILREPWSRTRAVSWRDALRIAKEQGFASRDLPED